MILLLLGAPGAGKGTISAELVSNYDFRQISTGDLLREEVASGSELGKRLDDIMKSGQLVSAELVNELVKNKITTYQGLGKNIILDGYPRNLAQAEYLDTYAHVDKAVNLEVDKNLLMKRLTGRRMCPKCGAGFNISTSADYLPDVIDGKLICKKCGAELIQRKDDNEETIKKRLETFEEQTKPLIDFYNGKNILTNFDGDMGKEVLIKKIIS
jgi:adenylate kinase